jgi:hypothetical protein
VRLERGGNTIAAVAGRFVDAHCGLTLRGFVGGICGFLMTHRIAMPLLQPE